MTAGAPWSVKGIDPTAREVAKDLAARAGLTLGEWLNRAILEGEAPPPVAGRERLGRAAPAPEVRASRDPFDRPVGELVRLTEVLGRLADRLDGSEARTGQAISTLETTIRATLRRLEQTAVRPPSPPPPQEARTDRYEGVLRALESALGRLAAQMQESETRTHDALEGVRARLDRAEARPGEAASGLDQISLRVGEIQDRTSAAMQSLREAFEGLDQRLARVESSAGAGIEDRLREVSFRLGQRLDTAREEMFRELRETSAGRISELEQAFSELSQKVERVEREVAAAGGPAPSSAVLSDAPERLRTGEGGRIFESLQSRLSLAGGTQAASLTGRGDGIAGVGDPIDAPAEGEPSLVDRGHSAATRWEPSGSEEIARRIRQSEDRTARLLQEARLRLDAHFPPATASAAPAQAFEDDRDGTQLLFAGGDEPNTVAANWPSETFPQPGEASASRAEDWSLDLLTEARAANARNAFEAPGDTPQPLAEAGSAKLPGFDFSRSGAPAKPRRFAGPGLASLAVFCVSASLVGFGVLSLFDKSAGGGARPDVSRTEPNVLATAPRPQAVAPSEPEALRASVVLAPAPVVSPSGAKLPQTNPTVRQGQEVRFRKAQADLAAGRPSAAPEIQALATAGYGPAMRTLSGLIQKGEAGLSRDPALARSWLRRAAESGDRVAMHAYGLELMSGENGPRDPASAVGWIRRAAEAGLVGSQFNLGAVYERGMGVPQDLRQALVWYSRAAEGGDGEALRQVERLKPVLAAAASRSPEDVRLAQRALARLGYYSGPADGAATPRLRAAIEAYQKDQKSPPTGLLDEETLKRLAMLGR